MIEKILSISKIKVLNKDEKSIINGAIRSNQCEDAISLNCDGCLCLGWVPQGCKCVPSL